MMIQKRYHIGIVSIILISLWGLLMLPVLAQDSKAGTQKNIKTGAVILLFHRFGENKYPSTSIRTEQLDAMIQYIQDNDFKVWSLQKVLSYKKDNKTLPRKVIVLTIDDAFKSVYTVAYPKFKEAGFPFTVFVSTGEVNRKNKSYMSWDNIRELSQNGVEIENHTVNHGYLVRGDIQDVRQDIEKAQQDILKHTGITSRVFAYPYGETNTDIINLVKELGFTEALGQHSGVYNETSPQYYIPRFSVNERYGTLKRFKLVLNAKAFPVENFSSANPEVHKNANPPQIEFTVRKEVGSLYYLQCFIGGSLVPLKKDGKKVQLLVKKPFKTGRTRLNCTLPHIQGGFRWLGMQYVVQKEK